MPQIPSPYNDLPLVKDLPLGTLMTIVKAVEGKTEKNSYPSVTLTTLEQGDLFSIDAGIVQAIEKVGANKITKADPLKVRTAQFKNKFGKLSYTIKNV
jgi:hypothetical protein